MHMRKIYLLLALCAISLPSFAGTSFMTNVPGRNSQLLNGKWDAIVDLYDQGERMQVYRNMKPSGNTDFYEYTFDGGLRLDVPGDWNSQHPKLEYYEGTVWYARHFDAHKTDGQRQFLYFGAVSYRCKVYLNGEFLMAHEGGFTPFEIEVTDKVLDGDNFLVVEVNNRRTSDAIPALAFDWWNYGGITRDVMLITTPKSYVRDYFIRLDTDDPSLILASVEVDGACSGEVRIAIPELKIDCTAPVDAAGKVETSFKVKKLERWAPGKPKLYKVSLSFGEDVVEEEIGFRTMSVDGTKILVNGKPTFMRCVSFHEEIPQRRGRAFSEADAQMLLSEAEALGVNMIRLAHYPQNEYIVRLAEKKGIILWQEIPVWQGIDFDNAATMDKALGMFSEMLSRDRNRCAVGFWGIANETRPSPSRNAFLRNELALARSIDPTRLYTAAFDNVYFKEEYGEFRIEDPLVDDLDVISFNKYMGWYAPWPVDPSLCVWNVAPGKPVLISEFGGEALYGQSGDENVASSWSEDYQARLYRDNLEMFRHIPNLAGVSPWILFDFRSPFRFHPVNQDGWNRKGLVSDRGERKKAWYIIHDWYRHLAEE
ncbi:MAG: glycoside hydrolase family 2 protein [Candidatus Cryptobacteroides sp.]